MQTLNPQQYEALSDQEKAYWKYNCRAHFGATIKEYTPVLIPLADAEMVIYKVLESMYDDLPTGEVGAFDLIKLYRMKYKELTEALNQLKDLNK